ncbi:MAG: hypothetical protein COW63_12025 [Bacteroidetes bacterium CG18_big_fil_WC_8_21_14_2_50_41_14]|nr:MAG: hypothetical protein COW63_12025 [Bacteroidetes bacterium CG18_big_fil_WC_8_21_14_2_50_41_14]PJB56936.1 MAG: hypothetical protein CO098_12650 [Bacteroidetes bacterium CG_4_9_14_3_um_filter_41_19]
MLKKILQLIVVLFFTASGVMAQTVQIENATRAPGDILVQVDMLNYTDDVAAITLNIGFDSDLMDFTGISGTTLTGSWMANYNSTLNQVMISYTATPTGTGYPINGKLLDLMFFYKGGFSTDLTFFESTCEIADKNLAPIPSTYINGSVTQLGSDGTVSMADLTDQTIGNTILMPVTIGGGGFGTVDAITLKIMYDPAQLSYSGLTNTLLAGFAASAGSGILTLTWTGAAQDFTVLSTLFDIQFVYYGGVAAVEFAPGCEIASGLSWLPTTYVDGSFTPRTEVASLTLSDIGATPGTAVQVPIVASGFGSSELGAITLHISYDDSLIFTGISNAFYTGMLVTGNSNNQITIEWSNQNNTTLLADDAVLVNLNFNYAAGGGEANVVFDPASLIQSTNLVNIPVTYIDGSVASFTVTFTVTDDFATPIADAVITFDGTTYGAGVYVFNNLGNGTYPYSVAKAGYLTATGSVVIAGADVTEPVVLMTLYSVSGQVTYMGDNARPVGTDGTSTTTVYLKNPVDSTVAYTTGTDASGNYTFTDVLNGTYFLDASTDIDATLSYDLTDAFVIFGIGGTLTGLQALAADVNVADGVDVTDAFIVYGSWLGGNVKVPAWIAQDWFFDNPVVIVTSNLVGEDFSAICSGDANGDFVPIP